MNALVSVKTVTLSEDAYAALVARKREGESFSDVVRRLSRSDRSLRPFVGAWNEVPADRISEFEYWLERSNRASRSEMLRAGRKRRD